MMKICQISFNIILLIITLCIAGCQSTNPAKKDSKSATKKKPSKKEATVLRIHPVINRDNTDRSLAISVYRFNPMTFYVDRMPLIDEGYIQQAAVVTNAGTYEIYLQFNQSGVNVLDTITSSFKGRHVAIYCEFGESRWLAAPIITGRIANGVYSFTPDASREETERIVRGLNNVAGSLQPKKKEW